MGYHIITRAAAGVKAGKERVDRGKSFVLY